MCIGKWVGWCCAWPVVPSGWSFVLENALTGLASGRALQVGMYCKANQLGWRSGCFASEVEFSKGYRHFASVITLAKCGITVKVEVSL